MMPADGFQINHGETVRSERTLSDGQKNISVSCRECHSRLYTQHTQRNFAATINLRAGTLDNTSKIRPVAQMWTSSAQLWAIQQDILSYSGQPSDYTPWIDAWKASP
ncbi:GFA family protein [Bradyrhizobium sp. LB5.2]|uniref:GFA family protein n=1 Tax=unclassified Bradyrhizobium TaxID=2631580 RepID=UPI00339B8973